MRNFTTQDKPRQRADFTLDGRFMAFEVPSYAPVLLSIGGDTDDPKNALHVVQVLLDWLGAGLSDEDGAWLLARLKDPDDPFDIEDAVGLVEGLVEEVSGRPFTPSGDSSASPAPVNSTGGRHQEESTLVTSI